MDASLPSHLAHGNLNGDGFGIGWHNACNEPSDPIPCVFTSVTPAWYSPFLFPEWNPIPMISYVEIDLGDFFSRKDYDFPKALRANIQRNFSL